MRYSSALDMADQTITYRLIVKEVAAKNGVYATFMPKPLFGENGSGMHTHMSLFKDGRNQFFDGSDQYNLSPVGKQFIAGLLRHARELSAVFAQWVNSYKRLVPGFEAPVYVAWSQRNRSALIRIPLYKPGSEQATRAEIRCPDPACNPYLTFAALLHAGLDGIEQGYELEAPMETNLYHLTPEERREQGIVSLPETLGEAIDEFAASDLMRRALRRPHLRRLREAEAQGVGRVPRPAHAVGARPLPRRALERECSRGSVRIDSRSTRRPITFEPSSICSIDSAGTSRRRRASQPERTDSASGVSGEVPYIGHSTVPTTRPLASATRKPAVRRRSMARALIAPNLFPVCEENPSAAVKLLLGPPFARHREPGDARAARGRGRRGRRRSGRATGLPLRCHQKAQPIASEQEEQARLGDVHAELSQVGS